jgi:hypothetical protein
VVAEDNVDAVIVSAVGATTIAVVAEAVCVGLPLSVTAAVKVDVPLWVGTPEMIPVDGARDNPAGNLPVAIDQMYGAVPPPAAKAWE